MKGPHNARIWSGKGARSDAERSKLLRVAPGLKAALSAAFGHGLKVALAVLDLRSLRVLVGQPGALHQAPLLVRLATSQAQSRSA